MKTMRDLKDLVSLVEVHGVTVTARVAAEQPTTDISALKKFISEESGNIERVILAIAGCDYEKEIALELEKYGVFYHCRPEGSIVPFYRPSGYPNGIEDISNKDKRDLRIIRTNIKKRSKNKNVFMSTLDCGREVFVIFTPYDVDNENGWDIIEEKLLKAFEKSKLLTHEVCEYLREEEDVNI